MPHIPIILDTIEMLEQLDGYHETVSENIDNEMYKGSQLVEAQNLISSADSMLTSHKAAIDAKVAEFEGFLGI